MASWVSVLLAFIVDLYETNTKLRVMLIIFMRSIFHIKLLILIGLYYIFIRTTTYEDIGLLFINKQTRSH
jgi:hypothetical protein